MARTVKGLAPAKRKVIDGVVSNKWQKDLRQEAFLTNYFDTNSGTFGNAYKSAVKAGYSEKYARLITAPSVKNEWLKNTNKVALTPEHITVLIENIALDKYAKDSNKLRALELLAKLQGMLVDRSANVSLNIEAALSDLK